MDEGRILPIGITGFHGKERGQSDRERRERPHTSRISSINSGNKIFNCL